MALAGCGSHKGAKAKPLTPTPKDDAEKNQIIYTQAGNATGMSEDVPKKPLWKVGWASAELVLEPDGNTITNMKGASGTFFQDGKEASTFKATTAKSDKTSGDIDVNRQVSVSSLQYKTTLRCDHIHYASKGKQIVKATGNVQLDGQWGTVSGLQEVWATPDLKTFGTPDLFQKR